MNSSLLQRLRKELDAAASAAAAAFTQRRDARTMDLVRFHFSNVRNQTYRRLLERRGIHSLAQLPVMTEGLEALPIVEKDLLRGGGYVSNPSIPPTDVRPLQGPALCG